MTNSPAERLSHINAAIAAAAGKAGRASDDVTLIAVSKTLGPETIAPVIAAGQRIFGENRVQEAQGKWPALRAASSAPVELHLIGPLQSNKTADAVALFDAIHTVDRPKIAAALATEMKRQGRMLKLYVQVNTGSEPQKAGVLPGEADRFIETCRSLHGLELTGLMCIPPAAEDPQPHFHMLAKLAEKHGLRHLSMGMSGDFEAAIASGATEVRIGSAIFGHR
ncbi:YggS family pyridoxal phosphate enzyme [Agaricicola taiwanensis]|uniref:Pyridoxal phosphate homeostasis protein n=1 Tax=Agaricicola taiwanensis TaxID=591372 RepID=A0A8J2YF81_9RHOB|nr:YggS family pyridoxal phosphate-dependent enzyme [Agaricicola taiwanensis]GGE28743.1 YggS family pyridoxal phosphate enzyme [Agaricicola taiwanensis]